MNDTYERAESCNEAQRLALVEYLYDEMDDEGRARVEAHLESCGACRADLEQMRGTRAQLASWRVPDLEPGFAAIGRPSRPPTQRRSWWAAGLAAAAVLVLAAGAAIANLEVRYDAEGFSLRTGWGRTAAPSFAAAGEPEPAPTRTTEAGMAGRSPVDGPIGGVPWRDDLIALERRLRTEFTSAQAPTPDPTVNDAELLRRVRALIDESEARQRRELALRVAQVVRDVDAQRQADLVRIQRGLGALEGSSAADRQLLNYLMRVSTPRQ